MNANSHRFPVTAVLGLAIAAGCATDAGGASAPLSIDESRPTGAAAAPVLAAGDGTEAAADPATDPAADPATDPAADPATAPPPRADAVSAGPTTDDGAAPAPRSAVGGTSFASLGSWEPGIPMAGSRDREQTLHATGFRHVEVVDARRDPETREWVSVSHETTAPFRFVAISPVYEDAVCLGGVADDGTVMIERWDLEPSGEALGDDEAARRAAALGLVAKRFVVTQIYRGPLGEGVYAAEVAPGDRCLLALLRVGEHRALYRFEHAAHATPELLLDSVTFPALAECARLQVGRHRVHGVVWTLSGATLEDVLDGPRVALIDGDDDGRLDGEPFAGTRAEYDAIFGEYEDWLPREGW